MPYRHRHDLAGAPRSEDDRPGFLARGALEEARRIAERAGTEVDFVESELYAALDVLPRKAFDLVFTGIGALCWLPDIRRWAAVVAGLLKPGGRLFLREGHPMLWRIDEAKPDPLVVKYPYFETAEPLVYEDEGTYVDTETKFVNTVSHSWNHGLGEIVTALLAEGFTLTMPEEHDSVPWQALSEGMVEDEYGEWRLAEGRERLPLTYTLQAVK